MKLNSVVVIMVLVLGSIGVINFWINAQIEQAVYITPPAVSASTNTPAHKAFVSKMKKSVYRKKVLEESQKTSPAIAKITEEKRKKIIYEIPLDETILVQ